MDEEGYRLIATEEALRSALKLADTSVYGLVRDEEKLLQLLASGSDRHGSLQLLGRLLHPDDTRNLRDRLVIAPIDDETMTIRLARGVPRPSEVEVTSVTSELDSRRAGLVPDRTLKDKYVTLVGAGSVGSAIGLLLAQAGVGSFEVIDGDLLEASNVARHVGDLMDIGRSKGIVLADALRRRCVSAKPIPLNVDIEETEWDIGEFSDTVEMADLVIATTDSAACQFLVNDYCVGKETPGLFVGAWENAEAGEIFLYLPDAERPCYFCATGFRAELGDAVGPIERRQPYHGAEQADLQAEPGLGVDITHLASMAASYALAVLDPTGHRAPLLDPNRSFVLVHSGAMPRGTHADLFRQPFEALHARIRRDNPCPVCGFQSLQERS